MKKRAVYMLIVTLCGTLLSGCGFLPFQQDNPFQKKEAITEELEKTESSDSQEDTENVEGSDITEEESEETQDTQESTDSTQDTGESQDTEDTQAAESDTDAEDIMQKASLMAAQYDYDGAIELLKEQPDYESSQEMQDAVSGYENTRATCAEYPLDQITHIFFHTLIKDTSKAFDGGPKSGEYDQYMTTISEFEKIIQIMYDKGYVLVSPHDMATVNEDGTISEGKILLPPGKIPFVLSQDDVSYYHYMEGDGFADKLVLDENGKVKAQYTEDDGSISVGDYDLVPILDSFVEEHPDFSYHGRKGILAMTGYDGVLGYRTDITYKTHEELQDDQKQFLAEHPDFDYDQDVKDATAVADALKAEGWEFASHTWGHKNATESSAQELEADNEKWENYVAPILGKTDMIFFAFGADIGDWEGYSMDNDKFAYYKSRGYNYFCNVDSSQYWVQITDEYFRQGRRNLDGYRMYYNPEMLSDLFDVSDVWDSSRLTPVPEI